jgi:hypothetical protein
MRRQGMSAAMAERKRVLDLEHFLEALSRKEAWRDRRRSGAWRKQGRCPASYDRLWDALKQHRVKTEGTRAMIEVVRLGSKHDYDRLL